MSLIYTGLAVEGRTDIYCPQCSRSVGLFTPKEIGELAIAGIEPLCFQCEQIGVDDLPRQLFSPLERYFVGMGNSVFLAEWVTDHSMPEAKDLRMYRISLTTYFDLKTGRGVKYLPPLSSSLNHNKVQTSLASLNDG